MNEYTDEEIQVLKKIFFEQVDAEGNAWRNKVTGKIISANTVRGEA